MSRYPEHDKLAKVRAASQAIGEFITSISNGQKYAICERAHDDGHNYWTPTFRSIADLLAEHFRIDLDALEAEKRAMLDAQRELNKLAPAPGDAEGEG